MDSNKEKRPLSSEEIDLIKEDYDEKLNSFLELKWLASDGAMEEEDVRGFWDELSDCDSLEKFVDLSWSDWRDHLNVLDVDTYLDRDTYSILQGEELYEEIVHFVFLTAYGIELP